ncbi:MAG: hypothetical protein PVS3B3_36450 [Ktedonobacteraceae bacterium]
MKRIENKKRVRRVPLYIIALLILISGGVFLILRFANENANTSSSQHKTSTPTQLPTVQVTVQPLFTDDFADNSKGWSVANVSGYIRTLQNGALMLSDTTHNVLVESIPTSTKFTNFSLTTTFTFVQGDENDSAGLYLRGDSNLDHDYRIDIFGNNTYSISKEALNESNMLEQMYLVHPSHTPLLKPTGQKNVLAVSMQGPTMVMQINGETVRSLADMSYTHGQIALFVSNGQTSNGATAKFHSLVIYPLPDKSSH